ncbi:MAG: hypothetical protein OXM87_06290 [Truepera sp.]|nr:hypothetical protein [Truepera sp.]
MSYSDEAIALQLQLGEDSRWEFKQVEFAGSRPRGPSHDDLADEIAAFANANGGVLLCSVTDENGEATIDLHTTHLPMTVFASAPGYAAKLEREWLPSRGALALELEALQEGGSIIFPEATGHLPRLKGRLNPIRDAHDRTYLYTSNIAINEGEPQPVHFVPNEDLRLTDAEGTELLARIVDIVGRSALVEYRSYSDRDKG